MTPITRISAICLSTLLLCLCCCAPAQEAVTPSESNFDYVLGTQTFAPAYKFTSETGLVETARAIHDMGSNILKITLNKDYSQKYGLPRNASVRSLRDLARDEPSYRKVLDMPFSHYILWTYCFSSQWWDHGLTQVSADAEYRELYEFTRYLLTQYNRSGKTFLLGHWEGDWYLHPGYNPKITPDPTALQGMIDWLNIRQKAIEDAKRNTPHQNVQVFQYTEVNLVQKAMKGGTTLTNDVLPKTRVDFVSYSSYDSLQGEGEALRTHLKGALDYIESKLPPKPGLTGRRVFIGEYGFPARKFDPETQAQRARDVAIAGLEWGCPYVLYWEMYNNEVKDGEQIGFWLIDDKGKKQPAYTLHQKFLQSAHQFVANFKRQHHRLPTAAEYRAQAIRFLDHK